MPKTRVEKNIELQKQIKKCEEEARLFLTTLEPIDAKSLHYQLYIRYCQIQYQEDK
jgi:arginyl-tRNA--protein-N-Asp/Glu arginylyltransferase